MMVKQFPHSLINTQLFQNLYNKGSDRLNSDTNVWFITFFHFRAISSFADHQHVFKRILFCSKMKIYVLYQTSTVAIFGESGGILCMQNK